ncbi:MAG: DUF6282 family protein [Peptococcaceae bacterium]|jgi:hypothetical protein|nr:DUF6282 family protein [Peptococcaceae bacterium]MDH7525975.1 DUF6282 family protein [Peptococcaceae bacterium]
MHIHAGPSVANRKVDVGEMLIAAEEAGYAGFVVKDHYVPSAHGCLIAEKHLGKKNCRVFSSIALNNSVGGFNLLALDAAYNMGTRVVYMPTVSSKLHLEGHKGKKFVGSGNMTVTEEPLEYVDSNGKLKPEAVEVLEYIVTRPDIVLCTGHATPQEIDVLLQQAFDMGLKKVYVNHPAFSVNATIEQVARWASWGAYIEMTACEFGMVLQDDDNYFNSLSLFDRYLEAGVPMDKMVISSDFGQAISPHPVEGMLKFLGLLNEKRGFTPEQLALMAKVTPARLLGIDGEVS